MLYVSIRFFDTLIFVLLQAIYVGDVKDDDNNPEDPLEFTVRILPQRGSSEGGDINGHKAFTFIVIHFKIPPEYPLK